MEIKCLCILNAVIALLVKVYVPNRSATHRLPDLGTSQCLIQIESMIMHVYNLVHVSNLVHNIIQQIT